MTSIDTLPPALPRREAGDTGATSIGDDGQASAGDTANFDQLLDGLASPSGDQPRRTGIPSSHPHERLMRHAIATRGEVDRGTSDDQPEITATPEIAATPEAEVPDSTSAPLIPQTVAPLFIVLGKPPMTVAAGGSPAGGADPASSCNDHADVPMPTAPMILKATILQNETHFAPVQPQPRALAGTTPDAFDARQPIRDDLPADTMAKDHPADATANVAEGSGRPTPAADIPRDHGTHRTADATPQPLLPSEAATALQAPGPAAPPPHAGLASSRPAVSAARQVAEAIAARIPPAPAPDTPVAPGPVRVMTMRLDPAELGTVTVRMRLVGGALELHIHAASEAAADVLERDRTALSDILRVSGYEPGVISIAQRAGMPPISGQPSVPIAPPGFAANAGSAQGDANGRSPQDRRGATPDRPSSNQGYTDDNQTAWNGASGALYV